MNPTPNHSSPIKARRPIRVGRWLLFLAVLPLAALLASPAAAQSRIKDIVAFEGVRENLLVGYGLVVGLNGTGDSLNSAVFTKESLIGMLERLGVNARDTKLKTNNVAAVMVTATLPPFARQGSRIDVGDILEVVDADADACALAQCGEAGELANFRARFASVISVWWTKMLKQKQLGWFQSFYGQLAIIFPFVVASPRFATFPVRLKNYPNLPPSSHPRIHGPRASFACGIGQMKRLLSPVLRQIGSRNAPARRVARAR